MLVVLGTGLTRARGPGYRRPHLWIFSASSMVSGKATPLVSGRSSVIPPAARLNTTSEEREFTGAVRAQPMPCPGMVTAPYDMPT